MVRAKVFVEGGGNRTVTVKCQEGFRIFLEKSGLKNRMPAIVASGSRTDAYRDFKNALKTLKENEVAFLLVDSEGPIVTSSGQDQESPWKILKARQGDQWEQPSNAEDEHCHLMVQCMENWFLADLETLKQYFGKDFEQKALPKWTDSVEVISKTDVLKKLEKATQNTQKGGYGKGSHSFDLLKMLDPQKVTAASPWAKRFVETLNKAT